VSSSLPIAASWLSLPPVPGEPPLRCWWARPDHPGQLRGAVLLLPEVFGLNAWVRSVADRLAAAGYGVLAMPIFARTAPDLQLDYDAVGLAEGRAHRDRLSAADCLADAGRAIAWLQQQPGLEDRAVACVGFCFGGHLAMLVATLPQVALTCDFYGARVSSFCPGGGPATLTLVPKIPGDLLCICGDQDPLMPPDELQAIAAALAPTGDTRLRQLVLAPGAGHGFMCEARPDFHAAASELGWCTLLHALDERLPA
jgi:carboxymethylenebutenolidase